MSVFPRARITQALRESANCGVAMVVAPAGFGKSEAVRDAFGPEVHVIRPAWGDVSVETIARLLIEAVAPRARRSLNPLLQRPRSEDNRRHLAEWCAARLQAVDAPIVIEDFERLSGEHETLRFLERVTESTIPRTRWIFASRETPELPLARWLARDVMTPPLTAADLAFEPAEGVGLAAAMKVDIDAESIATLVAELGEWPLALHMALSSWERTRAIPPLRIRTRGLLFDYLETEVWGRLSGAEQQFFTVAANLHELRPETLAAAGFPESQSLLRRLHGRLLLLAQLGDGSYRLHDLFREFVLDRSRRDPAQYADIAARLAGALEDTGSIDEAIALRSDAGDWSGVIALLERHGVDRIESGNRSSIIATLRRIPQSRRQHPVVTGLRGYNLSLDTAESAEEELRIALKGDLHPRLRGQLTLRLAGVLANAIGRMDEALTLFQTLFTDEGLDTTIRMNAAGMVALSAAATGHAARAHDALQFCSGAMEAAQADLRATLHHRSAYAYFVLGDFGHAQSHATKAVELALAQGLDVEAARGYSILGVIAWAKPGDSSVAQDHLQAQTRHALAGGDRRMAIAGMASEMGLAADRGEDELYRDAYRRLQVHEAHVPYRNVLYSTWFRVMHLVITGDRAAALSTLRNMDVGALRPEEHYFRDGMLALLIASTDSDEAKRLLNQRIVIGDRLEFEIHRLIGHGGLVRMLARWLLGYADGPGRQRLHAAAKFSPRDEQFRDIAFAIVATPRASLTSQRLGELTASLRPDQAGLARFLCAVLEPPAAVANPLTRAELDVLRELRRGGTTDVIAARMGRSSHTILAHLRSACSKLGCSGRAAAVTHALEQGWLD